MTLLTLRTALRQRTGYRTDDQKFPDAVLTEAINTAIAHVSTVADWPHLQATETLTTTAGTATVTPNAARYRTKAITLALGDGQRHPLDEIPVGELDTFWGENGEPVAWCDWGGVIHLRPTPNAVYSLEHRYVRTETDLSTDGSTPLMPADMQRAALDYAAYLLFRRDGEADRAAEAQAGFAQWMQILRDNRRRGSRPVVPRIREWD